MENTNTSRANGGNVQAAIDAVERLSEPTEYAIDDGLLVIPRGKQVVDMRPFVDARLERPRRREGIARHTTLASFNAHVVRFADEHSAIFADDNPKAPSLTAVLDYHERGHDGAPRFGTHRSVYHFPLSDEWKAWMALPEKIEQGTLAAFLEDRIGDVLDPADAGEVGTEFAAKLSITLASPARLMELARGLSVRVDTRVANHVNLGSGESKLVFEEQHSNEQGGPVVVPGGFMLAIPVFKGGDLFKVPVRLTYRVSRQNGAIVWRIALHRADKVFRYAFDEAVKAVEQATGLPVFYGTPEATAS